MPITALDRSFTLEICCCCSSVIVSGSSAARRRIAAMVLIVGMLIAGKSLGDDADLVVLDAQVLTVVPDDPEASAFAVKDGRFVQVGSNEDVAIHVGSSTHVLRLGQRVVVPGFNDAHIHPEARYPIDSRLGHVPCGPDAVGSMDELIAALKRKADKTPDGEWVFGDRYEDTKLGGHPTRYDLDRASTRHPILISHSSGHVAAANSMALSLAKVTKETPDPRGGAFDRDENGIPNGVLREASRSIVRNAGPRALEPTAQEKREGLQRQFREYVERGITSIQIAGTRFDSLHDYRDAQVAGPPVRIYAMLRVDELDKIVEQRLNSEFRSEYFKLGAVKHFHGNSLSGQTCWLYEPYSNRPDYFGIPPRASQEELDQVVWRIHEAGLQACIHSNGDREIDMVLNAYERALQKLPRPDHRHRIEHASIMNEQILQRVKSLDVVLALHSYVYEHGDKMEAYGEHRWNWMHANRSALDLGIPVAGNSDAPVSKAIPLLRIQSMMTRQSAEGKVYGADQRVTFAQALENWTHGSAFASFDDDNRGTIAVGKLADFVVLNTDPRQVEPHEVGEIQVDLTVIGGEIVFERR